MNEMVERKVDPKEIVSANLLYPIEDKNYKKIAILTLADGTKLMIFDKRISFLFKFLDVNQRDILRLPWNEGERDMEFLKAIHRCNTKLNITYVKNKGFVRRIVSEEFSYIPHNEVVSIVVDSIKELSPFVPCKSVPKVKGMLKHWILLKVPFPTYNTFRWEIWTYNYNVGNKALRVGAAFTELNYGGTFRLWKDSGKIRVIHRGEEKKIGKKIDNAIRKAYTEIFPSISDTVRASMEARCTPSILSDIKKDIYSRRLFPRKVLKNIYTSIKDSKPATVWDVGVIFAVEANNLNHSEKYRINLSDYAYRILERYSES